MPPPGANIGWYELVAILWPVALVIACGIGSTLWQTFR